MRQLVYTSLLLIIIVGLSRYSKKYFNHCSWNRVQHILVCWKPLRITISTIYSVDKGRNLKYIRRSEDVQDVIWTSYVHSIYVLCLWGVVLMCGTNNGSMSNERVFYCSPVVVFLFEFYNQKSFVCLQVMELVILYWKKLCIKKKLL